MSEFVCEHNGHDVLCTFCKHTNPHKKCDDCDRKCALMQDVKCVPVSDMQIVQQPSSSILTEAARAVDGPRRDDYGSPHNNHTRTAAMWSAYLGVTVTAEQVCFMNILQKVSRAANRVTRDTLVDIAGYARNVELVQSKAK